MVSSLNADALAFFLAFGYRVGKVECSNQVSPGE